MGQKHLQIKVNHFSLIIVLLLLYSCGKDRTNFIAKSWHNTNSFFNGYYNANLLLRETAALIDEQYKYPGDDFFQIVYYGTEEQVKAYETDFDAVIEKNDIVMYKHPNGKWVDDCRFMNGKSHFYKQRYDLAMENFDFMLDSFPESKLIPEVYLWIAKTHYHAGSSVLAQEVLETHIYPYDTIEWSKKARIEYSLFLSRMAMDEEDYARAAELIEEQVDNYRLRRDRSEAYYLLGQLYDELGEFSKALVHLEQVEKFSQDYDLTFKSKIRIARLYNENQDDEEVVYDFLRKLLKDEKNKEYQDQIYYEYGLLELKKDSLDNAIDQFKESILTSQNNQYQKALSNYRIGKIFFEEYLQYDSAQVYFDQAAAIIPEDAKDYKEIKNIATTLRNYVTYKTTIAYQDSMLYLATLDKEELEKVVKKVIEEEERKRLEEERKRKEKERLLQQQQQQGQFAGGRQNNFLNSFGQRNSNQLGGTAFYFDNPTAVTSGIQQFQSRWGQRRNEDHWRRAKKSATFASNEPGAEGGDGGDGEGGVAQSTEVVDSALFKKVGDKYKYYKDIPRDEEMVAHANELIEEALYKLGQLYSLNLDEPDSAIKTFELLLDRYDDSEYTLRARYALYQLYNNADNPISNVHKNFIVNEHPKSVYAYLILGKDLNDLKEEHDDFRYAYTGLFSAYRDRQYETAIGFSDFLLAQFGTDNPELDYADLHYIRGMSYGYLGLEDSLRKILTYVVTTFPEADVTPIAKQTLGYLTGGVPKTGASTSTTNKPKEAGGEGSLSDPNNPRYEGFGQQPKSNDKIFVLLYLDKENITKNDANRKVSDFNRANFGDLNLKTFTFLYQGTHLLPYVSQFKTVPQAEGYITKLLSDPVQRELLTGENDRIFYIAHSNFKVAYGRKRMEDYMLFYENILKK